MCIQTALMSKVSITNVTFECLFPFMDCGNMCFEIALLSKVSITNVTYELFPSFMDCCNMYFQILLMYKVSITNVTFELFLSIMNCCNRGCSSKIRDILIMLLYGFGYKYYKNWDTNIKQPNSLTKRVNLIHSMFLYPNFYHIYRIVAKSVKWHF